MTDTQDPVHLARQASALTARVATLADDTPNRDPDQTQAVLTELVHLVRMADDAAETTAGVRDLTLSDLSWRLQAAIATRLTDQPLPIATGET